MAESQSGVNGHANGHANGYTNGTNGANESEPIAIVGAAARLPGEASSLQGLWDMMLHARSAHARVPKERWDADAWYHPDPDRKGSLNTTHGFFLDQDIGAFDAPFFSVTAKEAAGMDPTKRLLLEVAYEAFENAGMPIEAVAGSPTGCYVGSMTSDYEVLSTHDIYDLPHMAAAGSSEAMTANRVSWFFDLRGPSLTLDTACSSSLYALHLACQSLRLGETNMGLVAGVNVILHPNFMQQLVAMHMLSKDGISHAFDDRANGYGRGEGIGALIVKRLSDAIRDGDTIRAVIRGSGVNVDGKTPSVTMPSSDAQAELIRATYKEAGLPLTETQYVELHGTGTPVGDPIELAGIAATFGASASPDKPVHIGSIKPNVGHTEGCAGLAGVFKAMMSLEQGVIAPTAKVETINPKLKFAEWNLTLPQTALAWPTEGPRRVSVNSFGFGGANAHLIMDDAYHYLKARGLSGNHSTIVKPAVGAPLIDGEVPDLPKKLFVFSAREEPGIKRIAKTLGPYWESSAKVDPSKDSEEYISDVAYTLSARRTLFDYRSFAVADSASGLARQLEQGIPKFKKLSKHNGMAFVFTGQGAQWAGMGRQLVSVPTFAKSIAESKAILKAMGCPFDLEVELQKLKGSKIDTSEYSQPICTAVQVALIDLLTDWSVKPKAVVGHSSGEIAAAYAAGILSHEDAIKVAYLRGIYSEKVTRGPKTGAMLAAGIGEEDAAEYLKNVPKDSVVTACINSPKSVTLSGDANVIDELEKSISADSKFARKLRVATAYHSPHMRMVADECMEAMVKAKVSDPRPPTAMMFSSVTGDLVDYKEVGPFYWIRNMCNPVRFSGAVRNLLTYSESKRARKTAMKWDALVEIGPHSALKAPLTQIMEGVDKKLPTELHYGSMLSRGEDAVASVLKAAGQLWSLGISVSLDRVNRELESGNKAQVVIDLPAYPWNHDKQFWHETPATKDERLQNKARSDLLGIAIQSQNPFEPQWKNSLRSRENPWVEDHRITGTTLYPGAGMLIMVIEAAHQIAPKNVTVKGVEFKDVHFERGLVIPSEGATETMLRIQTPKTEYSQHTFAVFSKQGENTWTQNCHGSFSIILEAPEAQEDVASFEWKGIQATYEAVKKLSTKDVDVKKLYKTLFAVGMEYGPTFQNLTSLATSTEDGCCYGTVKVPDTKSVMPFEYEYPHIIHPATLDAIFHLIVVAVADGDSMAEAAVPFMLESLFVSSKQPKTPGTLYSGYSQRVIRRDQGLVADLVVSDDDWSEPRVIVRGLIMRKVSSGGAGVSNLSVDKAIDKRATKIVWKLDAETAQASSQIARLRDWLELECHKSPKLQVLLIGNELDGAVLEELMPFIANDSPYRGITRCTIAAASQEALEKWQALAALATASTDFVVAEPGENGLPSIETTGFDLVITGAKGPNPYASLALLHPNSHLLILHESKASSESAPSGIKLRHISLKGQELTIASTVKEQTKPSEVYFLTSEGQPTGQIATVQNNLREAVEKSGVAAHTVDLSQVASLKDKFVVSLLDLGDGFVTNWSATQFEQFQALVTSAAHVFWVTRGAQMVDPSEGGLVNAPAPGLLRVLRNEIPSITLVHLDLSPAFDLDGPGALKLIADAWSTAVDESAGIRELELVESGGQLFVPRSLPEPSLDADIALTTGAAPPVLKDLSTAGPLSLVTGDGEIAWRSDAEAGAALEPDQVEIRVVDLSVDSTSVAGLTVESTLEMLGSQLTGYVSKCGSNVTEFIEGDRVVAFGTSSCKTYVRQNRSMVLRLPESFPTEAAGTVFWLYMTASHILNGAASVTSGQSILVQDGASSLGQALIYIAQQQGGNVFTTVKSLEQKVDISSRFNVPKDHIIVSTSGSLAAYLLHKTGGKGLDVVIGSGAELNKIDDRDSCVSDFAHVIAIVGEGQVVQVPASLMKGNVKLSTVNTAQVVREKPELISKQFPKVLQLIQGKGLPEIQPRTKFSVTEFPKALSWLQKPEHGGIVTVQFSDEVQVPVLRASPAVLKLDPSAAYVLAGGVGSLGLRIAKLMAQSGAKHLVFLSRSGGGSGKYAAELEELHSYGCGTSILKCDVTSLDDVGSVGAEVAKLNRPVKGVVQLAMVLQDSLFDKMTYQQWCTAFRPKVAGTWNLHTVFPKDMDFFIMLSSVVSVIGNVAQANYAAGNSYMDAFAHYRRSIGLSAVSINAGLVSDSNHTIDGTSMEDYLDRFKHMASVSTTLQELDIGITASMRGATADGTPIATQFVFCMTDSLQPDGVDQWAIDPKFSHRRVVVDDGSALEESSGPSVGEALSSTTSMADATLVIQDTLKNLLAPGLGVQPADINEARPLYEVGVDSFKAVEIRNQVFRELKSDISVFEILSPSSLAQISGLIASRSQLVPAAVKEGATGDE
ncbi:lovastatin nonaketide synthase [Hypoxylon sp. NC1633]|nr:lovastatin nonaketide synthase [Hypoxylon sp. NC1633]